MRALALSGGGTKFIRHIAFADAAKVAEQKFHVIAGVSAGAIAAIPIAMGMLMQASQIGLNLTLDTFFDKRPVNSRGGFTFSGAWRLLRGKSAAGEMGNLRKLLKQTITPEIFQQYQFGNYATCYAMAVSLHTGSRRMWNLKEVDYYTAIEAIMASASIPFFTSPVWIDGQPYADGGLRDHSPGGYLVEEVKGIFSLTSVYTRPKDYQVLSPDKYKPKALHLLAGTIDVLNTEVSKNDEMYEQNLCLVKGIDLLQLYSPAVMKSVYDVDHSRLKELYLKSYRSDLYSLQRAKLTK